MILGGTGKTGRRIARRLPSARAASRSGGVRLDLGDPRTWKPALDGVTAVYLVEPDLHAAMGDPSRIPRFAAEAVAAGARRFVLLSAPRAGEADHPLFAAEEAVRGSGVEWTILRPDWFAQNFSESFWRPGILAGELALPTGDGRTPFVDADDIADVAAAALTADGHHGRTYHLTGPRALSVGEAVALIGAASGRTVRHVDVDPEAFVRQQVENGAPPAVARLLTGLFTDIRDGHGPEPSGDVARALGRPARTFEEYVAGAWGQPGV
ncbi:NAD(P)H-binding protein [Amycolatopsis acidicola]|uniref:NAD(P)H-binding protein n=1 Tax=Amycolatopsis acidicola TaxID=2596893 RepID=A0A5N0UTN7_9PSEU|nr:NAD(P)H-binding protein [Amycolatopsis acidicola]